MRQVSRSVLPHGLEVVTERVPASRTVAVGIFVRVGSRHEVPALHGASHFLEHVLFKGTPTRTAEQISAAVEAVGGELNAYTAKEHTCFYARVLPGDIGLAVDVLTDMLARSTVAVADVDAERSVILDEIAMHGDDPADLAAELAAAALLGPPGGRAGGLGQPVIGSPDSISAMSRAQIVRHWRRHYQPRGLVVAAAGRVDHDRLVTQLGALDDRRATPAARPVAASRVGSGQGVVSRQIRLEQATAVLAFGSYGVFDDRRYPLGLLSLDPRRGDGVAIVRRGPGEAWIDLRHRRG